MASQNTDIPREHHVHRPGGWLPRDHRVHQDWLKGVISHVEENPKPLHPVLEEFKSMIENDSRIYLLINSMFEEIPSKHPYNDDPTGHPQVRDYHHMLQLLNHICTTAPSWNDRSHRVGMVGVPINALFDWPMGTPSGFAVFLDPQINAMLKKVLNLWGEYLQSPESADVLGKQADGWFSEHGVTSLAKVANVGGTSHAYEDLFICDPSAPNMGYKSWDDFFTRRFREGARPVASPDDDDVVVNACESLPYTVAHDVKYRDRFWAKGQPYSVVDMLSQDNFAEQFVGGTVYQAFLSALSYHRWHSPISGTIKKAYVVPGTYFSEPLFEGLGDPNGAHDIDLKGETTSQGYLTATAARAIIFIQADNPRLGLTAFLGIGMTEVSTCEITVKEGQHVKKGDELGMFHFGGSTHVVLFRKGVKLEGFPETNREENVPVRGFLAKVVH